MATIKTKGAKTASSTITLAQAKRKIEELEKKIEKFEDGGYCTMCATHKSADKFYYNSDPMTKSELSPICRDCARKLALRVDANGEEHEPTKESVQLALRYLNRPFLNTIWNASIQESENLVTGKVKHNVWSSYAKNMQMQQYLGLTYFDSDMFKEKVIYEDEKTPQMIIEEHAGQDTYDDFIKNKKDVIRLLNYDPFEQEAVSDQPFLYSQLLGLLDAGGDENDDMMRNASAIAIVRGFLQISKIDNNISQLMSDYKSLDKNSATIKSLQDAKSKVSSVVTSLAKESCISLLNNKNAKKGENTWTGKIKKIKDLNLRDGRVNGFDIATCRGMQQVQEISDASIMKQLALDESDWSDMVAEMRKDNQSLRKERDSYKEINRILLQENIDLKDYLEENDININMNLKDLKDLYSVFADEENMEENMEEVESDEPDNTSL